MAARNIFVVRPDLGRWSSERPVFTPEPVGPRPMEEANPAFVDWCWVVMVMVLVLLVLLSIITGS